MSVTSRDLLDGAFHAQLTPGHCLPSHAHNGFGDRSFAAAILIVECSAAVASRTDISYNHFKRK